VVLDGSGALRHKRGSWSGRVKLRVATSEGVLDALATSAREGTRPRDVPLGELLTSSLHICC
jgi:hypothetical protein